MLYPRLLQEVGDMSPLLLDLQSPEFICLWYITKIVEVDRLIDRPGALLQSDRPNDHL